MIEEQIKKEPINVTYKVPIQLANNIDELIKNPSLAYRARGQFIEDAIRHWITIKEKELIEKMKMVEYFKTRGI
jgi:metal-responsive CopG/Arc/MetJ family transcriptional regulator